MRDGVMIAQTANTSYLDATVTGNTTYTYTVKAEDNAGNISAASVATTVTTPSLPDSQAPSRPTNVTAVLAGVTQVNLTWTASTDNSGVAGYNVLRNGVKVATVTTTSYGEANLTPGTTYQYTITAVDAAGNTSSASEAVLVTVPTPATPVPTARPTATATPTPTRAPGVTPAPTAVPTRTPEPTATAAPTNQRGSVAGRVTANGQPRRGVRVALSTNRASRRITTTDRSGQYLLKARPDTYTLKFAEQGFEKATYQVEIKAGQTLTQDHVLVAKP
jgi:chitodextrinase